jgi:hypothetical protein
MGDAVGSVILDSINKAFTNPDDVARMWVGLKDLAQIFLAGAD